MERASARLMATASELELATSKETKSCVKSLAGQGPRKARAKGASMDVPPEVPLVPRRDPLSALKMGSAWA